MAKFYSILSVGHGTLGSQYLRRTRAANGKEINVLANKNFTPTNPKTETQMAHRAKFANAVKFYKRAVSNFFKFAYEDKKPNESDYNAFMRHNINRAVAMVKAQSDNSAYPAMGKYFQMTEGTLNPLSQKWNDNDFTFGANAAITAAPSTVGDISAALVAMGYTVGQIFTFVVVTSSLKESDFSLLDESAIGEITSAPKWNIMQFIINPDDATELASVATIGDNFLSTVKLDTVDGVPSYGVSIGADVIAAAAAIITENVSGSTDLKCATSYLLGNSIYNSVLDIIGQDHYYSQMLSSWGAHITDAILKGSLSGDGTTIDVLPTISAVNGVSVPASLSADERTSVSLTGANFDSEHELTENSFSVRSTPSGSAITGAVSLLNVTSGTTATLSFAVDANTQVYLYFGDTLIAEWYNGQKA